jgi:hypothetical protein
MSQEAEALTQALDRGERGAGDDRLGQRLDAAAPRKMFVFPDGRTVGTIGAGATKTTPSGRPKTRFSRASRRS